MPDEEKSSLLSDEQNNPKEPRKMKLEHIPLAVKIIYLLSLVSLVLYILFRCITPFADWFNTRISAYLRLVLAKLTVWIPFSFAEILFMLLPVAFVALCVISFKFVPDRWRSIGIWAADVCVVLAVIFNIFVWNFAAGYSASSLDKRLGIDTENISKEDLYAVTCTIIDNLNEASLSVVYEDSGASIMPYGYREMNQKLMQAYESFSQTEIGKDLYLSFSSRVKNIILSRPMSYTRITGVYTFFTGEANINVDFPAYTIPYTAAHELAHQRGFARENEANFIAYLICHHSDDVYLRYSAEMNMFEYLYSILYSADHDLADEAVSRLSDGIRSELRAYYAFLDTRENKVVRTISHSFNDTYLKSQGTEGSISYDLVAYLTVAYYNQHLD
ncbi:MAG: DUF3810 domain-containing protein [Clostridia bacterium]|nr:DUF3810 domain-containing protein [Clostridia bacterium]